MKRTLSLFGILSIAVFAGCNATNNTTGVFGSGGSGGSTASGGSNSGGSGGSTMNTGGDGGLFGTGGFGQGGSTNTNECISDGDEDKDKDGFSVNQGDCNDCDPNVNPGAIEVATVPDEMGNLPDAADEDCDGTADNVAPTCDDGIALGSTEPDDGAKAVDLCKFVSATDKGWGVLSAQYVRANGSTGTPPNALQYGILDNFGTNVNVQGGARMLGLSSGHARDASDAGACGNLTCTSNTGGTAPPGFPQDVPSCPGSSNINDDVALELQIRSPKNATGYSFNFKFYSFEYPEWVCTSYNDQYISLVSPPPPGSIGGNISFDSLSNPVSVNVAFFNVCAGCPLGTADLAGTGFDTWNDAGATDWLLTQAPVTGGDIFTIRFTIWDTGDSAYDSTVLVDNFAWIANGGTVVVGTEPIPDPK